MLPSAPQTLDSLSCNGSEELEQLQLEMTDLRQEVRRLKVDPLLPADPSAGAFCWHSGRMGGLWGGLSLLRGLLCTKQAPTHSSPYLQLSLKLKQKLIT